MVALLGVKRWHFNDAILDDFRISRFNAVSQKIAVIETFDESIAAFLSRCANMYMF